MMVENLEEKADWWEENFDEMWNKSIESSNQKRREFMYPIKIIYSIGSALSALIEYLF